MKLAWIGTGVMGKAMALHLHEAGYTLQVYNRTYEKAADLKGKGIKVCHTIAECVSDAEVVFTMVGYPSDVEEIYQGSMGIFQQAKKGALLIDIPLLQSSYTKRPKTMDFICWMLLYLEETVVRNRPH